jgi:lipid-A-disaccharide synthase-like uncharacterized protein
MSTEQFWLSVGLGAPAFFSMRFVVRRIVSERRKASVMPLAFWLFSVCGGLLLLTYTIHRDPVFVIGELKDGARLVITPAGLRRRHRSKIPMALVENRPSCSPIAGRGWRIGSFRAPPRQL